MQVHLTDKVGRWGEGGEGRGVGVWRGKEGGGEVMLYGITLPRQHRVGNIVCAKMTQPTRPSRFIRLI